MENEINIKVAIVRGDSLNEWETGVYSFLPKNFLLTGFCSKKNLYPLENIHFPIQRLASDSDGRFSRWWNRIIRASFQNMVGLEKELVHFDIVHTAELYHNYTYQAIQAKKINPRLKVVVTVWDNSFGRFEYNYWPGFKTPPQYWRYRINKRIQEVVANADMFIAVSSFTKELLRSYGVPEEKIRIIAPGIAIEKQIPVTHLIERLELKNKNIFLLVNRLVKEKGIYDVIFAWELHKRQGGVFEDHLLIIGQGPEKKNLERLVHEKKLTESISIIGSLPHEEVLGLYSISRALILASLPTYVWQEQFGYVLAEAMSLGCPVISTLTGAIPEVVGDGGILVNPGNPPEIARALMKLHRQDQFESYRLATKLESKRFSAKLFADYLAHVYRQLVV